MALKLIFELDRENALLARRGQYHRWVSGWPIQGRGKAISEQILDFRLKDLN
jgi:hypothetical protein